MTDERTDDQLNQALHKLLGLCWHVEPVDWEYAVDDFDTQDELDEWEPVCPVCEKNIDWEQDKYGDVLLVLGNPDYCTDLNAVHKIEMGLSEKQRGKYADYFFLENELGSFGIITAPARERVPALIETLKGDQ